MNHSDHEPRDAATLADLFIASLIIQDFVADFLDRREPVGTDYTGF